MSARKPKQDSVVNAAKLLDEMLKDAGVKCCFCTLCSHQPEYGHCYSCPCGNHVAAPTLEGTEEKKLRATVSHLIKLLYAIAKDREFGAGKKGRGR